MVSRNNNKSTVEATRVSARISMRLKSSKSAASVSKVTKVTSKTTSKANGGTKKTTTQTTASKRVSIKTKASSKSKKNTGLVTEEEDEGNDGEGDETETPKPQVPKYDPSPVEPTILTLSTITGEEEVHPGITHLLTTNPSLSTIITRHPCTLFSASGLLEPVNPFHSLCSGIISQQVSSAAAASIKSRFIALFNATNTFPTPSEILTKDINTLRTAGLSQRKAEYITGLAELFVSGDLTNELLLESSDDAVTEKLIKVRGLGLWSIQMFLLFALKRTDVFATGDLGIQRGMAILAGRDVNKLKFSKPGKAGKWKYMAEDEMVKLAEVYSPYRSLLSWYLWRLADTDVEVLKGVDKTTAE
ncbi:3-methyladenine DNA glycosylase [Orbilia oligospora]|uniref:3-methyladenine DNA glycosylase n=1 Tax=Orbilia oligospora TaxID=2813651 RepID=A0A7C8NDR4_ORBOL|nr:3-methyladenine DNA glycosylase [Orbilia oligospora]KAF3095621.1 3-methyladenine DNA glycosylase [Orbilia oligospora]